MVDVPATTEEKAAAWDAYSQMLLSRKGWSPEGAVRYMASVGIHWRDYLPGGTTGEDVAKKVADLLGKSSSALGRRSPPPGYDVVHIPGAGWRGGGLMGFDTYEEAVAAAWTRKEDEADREAEAPAADDRHLPDDIKIGVSDAGWYWTNGKKSGVVGFDVRSQARESALAYVHEGVFLDTDGSRVPVEDAIAMKRKNDVVRAIEAGIVADEMEYTMLERLIDRISPPMMVNSGSRLPDDVGAALEKALRSFEVAGWVLR